MKQTINLVKSKKKNKMYKKQKMQSDDNSDYEDWEERISSDEEEEDLFGSDSENEEEVGPEDHRAYYTLKEPDDGRKKFRDWEKVFVSKRDRMPRVLDRLEYDLEKEKEKKAGRNDELFGSDGNIPVLRRPTDDRLEYEDRIRHFDYTHRKYLILEHLHKLSGILKQAISTRNFNLIDKIFRQEDKGIVYEKK